VLKINALRIPAARIREVGLDTGGTVLGHISVLDDKPMSKDPRAISHFEIFAARATAELRCMTAADELRAREE
jgi:hypothetical protein